MELPDLAGKNFYLFILLVLPGFIAQSVYDLFIPHGERDASANLFLGVAYGTVNLVLTWPLVYWAAFAVSQDSMLTKSLAYGVLLFALAIFPALLGITTYRMRNSRVLVKWGLVTPHPTSWDSFFARRETCWVIFRLKSGAMIGGHYEIGSHASSFPNEADVYVSEVWRLGENGEFTEQIEDTMGMLIRREDCELIEFKREAE